MAQICKNLFGKVLFAFISFFFVSTMSIAQGDTGNDPDFPDVPIDGGLSLLLAAGAAYGGKKVYNYRKSKNQTPS
jgi:hypothetical protein